mgnify:CR=1 FL=1
MEEIKTTKVCTKCGIEKPISDFGKYSRNKDGLSVVCKECTNKKQREYLNKALKKVYTNPELAAFQPRELINELRARGYSGELTFTQRIVV